jgi:membrane protease YdiL (CAAX protease family)
MFGAGVNGKPTAADGILASSTCSIVGRLRGRAVNDISQAEIAAEPKGRAAGYWTFWGTTLWGLASIGVLTGVHFGATTIWQALRVGLGEDQRHDLTPVVQFVSIGLPVLGALAVLALAIRLSRLTFREYLGLAAPRWRYVLLGIAGFIAISLVFAVVENVAGGSQPAKEVVDLYHSARTAHRISALAFLAVLAAPLLEELLFRGFLLPGWAASRLGPTGAIGLSSALWALGHMQYDAFGMAHVFCLGVLLGWLRLRSGSIFTPMILHALQNAGALAVLTAFNL